jgi:hypothetical protein
MESNSAKRLIAIDRQQLDAPRIIMLLPAMTSRNGTPTGRYSAF